MEEKIPGIYELSKDFYIKMSSVVKEMIEYATINGKKVSKDTLCGFDHYIQSYLYIVGAADEVLDNFELSFIKEIVDYDDLFTNVDKASDNMDKVTKDIVSKVPQFVKLSLLCDKINDEKLITKSPTYCQIVYDNMLRLANYFKYVDGYVAKEEDTVARRLIQPVRDFYLKNYATFAPKRKMED